MLLDYAVVTDPADDTVVPKQGSIKVVVEDDQSKVICERATHRTAANKVQILQ